MKYPPFSWLRLNDEIRQSPNRIWFSFNKLPKANETCHVRVHIGSQTTSLSDPYEAFSHNSLVLAREQKVLEVFLKIAKPQKNKSDFTLDHAGFGLMLPYSSIIPFEVLGLGVISKSQEQASIKAELTNLSDDGQAISFTLIDSHNNEIKNPHFFGDVNAYIIDEKQKLYLISQNITQSESHAILTSAPLPLLGLCQKQSRNIFYTLSRLGVDFSCLKNIAVTPRISQVVLRLLLSIDDLTKKMCARAHLVTEIAEGDFLDEVEIKSTGFIPTFHILADADLDEERFIGNISAPILLKRPHDDEIAARDFLYHLGAGPARLHDGFELSGNDALLLLKSVSHKDTMPPFIKLDDNARPTIIELPEKITLHIKADEATPKRVEVAMGLASDYDETDTEFSTLINANDTLVVLDADTLIVINPNIQSKIKYFAEMLGLSKPSHFKSKSTAQIALLLNSFGEDINIEAKPELLEYLYNFSIKTDDFDRTLPTGLKTTLRPYQHDAVAWLSALNRSGLGGLLGDEMGLGKTLMVLTHLARQKELTGEKKPALVVCPTSVIDVWKEEARIHLPSLKVVKWHGPDRIVDQSIRDADIVITSYAILRRDVDTKLKSLNFGTLVLDEAQYVRNQQTDSFKSAKAIKCDHRIALTGTPIENHLMDLYNILDCVEDGILGPKSSFEKQFVAPLEAGLSYSAVNLKMLIAPIVMRRRKAEVESELPPKIENVVHCLLSPKQRELYNKYIHSMSGTILANINQEAPMKGDTHFSLLSALTRLRQICCHPSLILDDDKEHSSGKLDTLREIIKECLEMGRKMIIYSQFLKMQELIVNLAQELEPKGALWLHGSTQNRDEIVKSFQSEDGPRIIVVSLKAGGTGITLTAADTVIFADPWWNPAVEDQAVDRAHRIGQKKTVHVIRVIADNSIEGEVVALAQRKRHAAMSVLHEGFKTSANLTKDEVRGLLLRELDRIKPVAVESTDYEDSY